MHENISYNYYPILKHAFEHTRTLRSAYEAASEDQVKEKFDDWIQTSFKQEIKQFCTVANSSQINLTNILHFFHYRNTNANAESLNSKIKLFRANLRGVSIQLSSSLG